MAILLCCGASGRNAVAEPSPGGRARACSTQTLGDGDPSPEISTWSYRRRFATPTVIVFDARPPEEYAVQPRARRAQCTRQPNLPPSAYTADISAVLRLVPDRKRRLVLYCNGLHCGRSKRFAPSCAATATANVRR